MKCMKENLNDRIKKTKTLFNNADYVLIGAGAGLSTAGGFEYSGENFEMYFSDFGKKYGFKDMYSGGFYPYKTLEEKWAFWSRYIFVNRYLSETANPSYKSLLELVKNKNYFVITTNVDHQFQLSGFDKNRIFYMQGDYGLFQCEVPCHNKTYDNKDLVLKMLLSQNFLEKTQNGYKIADKSMWKMQIDSSLIPKCPVCGKNMTMNLRADDTFIQDDGWEKHAKLYEDFLEKAKDKKLLLMEFGVGYNTPVIIKYPFEKMTYLNKDTNLIRFNKDYAICSKEISNKTILFDENIETILNKLKK